MSLASLVHRGVANKIKTPYVVRLENGLTRCDDLVKVFLRDVAASLLHDGPF